MDSQQDSQIIECKVQYKLFENVRLLTTQEDLLLVS
jgi:hypothetical protein